VRIKSFVLGGAALLSLVGLSAPALSHTHHPSTATERKQTNDLNTQALAQAQGQPMQQQAANTAMPNASTAMPEQQNNAMTSPSTAAPADQQRPESTKPAQPGDQNAQTPQAQTPQPSPQQ